LPINPGGQPFYQEVPDFPADAMMMYQEMGRDMDSASGLMQTAQGTETPEVKSGKHALAIIGQTQAGLSEPATSIKNGVLRSARITAQLARAFLDQPRRLRWQSESGRWKEKEWSGADLLTNLDFRIKPGTGTMLDVATKAQF